jgi:hypothetical protein
MQHLQQRHNRSPSRTIQIPRRLIRQHNRRPPNKRPRNRNPLPLTTRQLRRTKPSPMRQPHPSQRLTSQHPPLRTPNTRIQQPISNILQHRRMLRQKKLLKHKTNPRRPQPRQLPIRQTRHIQPRHPHHTRTRPIKRPHQMQQRRLPRPRRTHNRNQLTTKNRETHTIQRHHRRLRRIHLRHPLQLEHGDRPARAGIRSLDRRQGAHSRPRRGPGRRLRSTVSCVTPSFIRPAPRSAGPPGRRSRSPGRPRPGRRTARGSPRPGGGRRPRRSPRARSPRRRARAGR